MSILGCKCRINPATLTDHKPWVWTWCFDLHPRTKTKRQNGLSVAGAGKCLSNGDRKRQWPVFFQNTNTNPPTLPGLSFFRLCVILNGSLQTSDVLSKSRMYIENVALAQCCSHPRHSCKKYDFLPAGNFLFMSAFRSIEGDSVRYLIHGRPSPEVTPCLMMQDAVEPMQCHYHEQNIVL